MDESEMDKIAELFFEFLRHMEDVTDVVEAMAKGMRDLNRRVSDLENKSRKRNENDDDWTPRTYYL